MGDEMEDFVITGKEHRLYKKFRKHVENFYKVKINMPQFGALDSDIVLISLYGEKSCRNGAKKFISDKMRNQDVEGNGNVLIVTLSDISDDESTSANDDVPGTPSSKLTAASSSLHDESVLIIEDPVSPSLKTSPKKSIKKFDLLEDSICVIESPMNTPQVNTKRKCRKNHVGIKKKARIEINISDESKLLQESPALQHSSDFIPLFDGSKSNFKRHKSALNHQTRQGKMIEGEITLIEPCSVNNNVNFLPCTLPSTQKNEEIVRIDRNMPTYSLRPIVIDGCNVAMAHGNGCFSAEGIQLAINFFLNRGHTQITTFLPQFHRHRFLATNPEIIEELSEKQLIVFVRGRRLDNKKIIQPYDDRFIVELASRNGGAIVSNDKYRDLMKEKNYKEVIEQRSLMFCFVGDEFMVPEDPLGRNGPTLTEFLSFPCNQ